MRILAGDIGGTNTRLQLFDRDERPDAPLRPVGVGPTKFKNAEHESLDAILRTFAPGAGTITDACFGIAGPVEGRGVKLTNIPHWPVVHADEIAGRLAIQNRLRVNVINDMPAHAASLSTIERDFADHVVPLVVGATRPTGTKLIVMPGTGLGVGMLVHDAKAGIHRPVPTEAGHADLSARDDAVRALIASMKLVTQDPVITREHLIAGPGLRAIYACLKNPAAPDVAAAPKPEAIGAGESTDPIARRALDLFAQLVGELCGNAAFGYLATGGIYLAGSIANSLRSRLDSPAFREPFESTGPLGLRGLIRSIPVKLVTFEETGLLGAATYATWAAEGRI